MTNRERSETLETVRCAVLEVELPVELTLSQRALLARFVTREVARRLPLIPQPES
jgi:hypothetical protein